MPAKRTAPSIPNDREIALSLGRALVREADCSGNSNTEGGWDKPSNRKARREWLLRWMDAATTGDGEETRPIEEAGWGALDLRWSNGACRNFLEPIVDEFLRADSK